MVVNGTQSYQSVEDSMQKAQSGATGVFVVKLTGSNFWSELLSGLQRPVWSVLVTHLFRTLFLAAFVLQS